MNYIFLDQLFIILVFVCLNSSCKYKVFLRKIHYLLSKLFIELISKLPNFILIYQLLIMSKLFVLNYF